jgi:hypothetical protein
MSRLDGGPEFATGDVMWVLLLVGSSLRATYIHTYIHTYVGFYKVGSMTLEASYFVSVSNSMIFYVRKSIGLFNLP